MLCGLGGEGHSCFGGSYEGGLYGGDVYVGKGMLDMDGGRGMLNKCEGRCRRSSIDGEGGGLGGLSLYFVSYTGVLSFIEGAVAEKGILTETKAGLCETGLDITKYGVARGVSGAVIKYP